MTRREPPLDYPFRARLKQLRREKNLTQKQIGDAVNLSPITISGWEIGKSMPDAQTLPLLADFLGVSIDYLLGREAAPLPSAAHQVAFAPVFGNLRYHRGQLQCLDYRGAYPLPTELQDHAGEGGLVVVIAPPDAKKESGLCPGDRVALWVGLPFEDGELCGVLIGTKPLQLLRVTRINAADASGYALQNADATQPAERFPGDQAERVYIVGPCAGLWKFSHRLTK